MLLTTAEVATFLGLKPITLVVWRVRRIGPPFVRVGGRTIRYNRSDLERYIAANTASPEDRAHEHSRN
jgi:excisionase family DNA binding protein